MPLTVTLKTIKAHQAEVDNSEITPDKMPPCIRCNLQSRFFKFHAHRERKFLVLVMMIVTTAVCALVRFKCPNCGKTFTNYPDFAIPYKHYVVPVIEEFSGAYVESDQMTYRKAVMVDYEAPGYPDGDRMLSSSTIHRWITTLGGFSKTCQKAKSQLLQEDPGSRICQDLAQLKIPARKYRSRRRKNLLYRSRSLLIIEAFFKTAFKISVFTELGTKCAFR